VSGAIGRADDFYRLRVMRVDEGDVPELEWRDDVLYRRPAGAAPDEYDVWRVEAVDVDDEESVTVLASFATAEEAHENLETVSEDLASMTRSEFERTYFPPPPAVSAEG
jgi:hypothetical protein